MGKSISIYVPDELAEKMEKFGEVNWSEIARRGIEDYVEGRIKEEVLEHEVPQNVINEFQFFLDTFGDYLKGDYTYSLMSIYQTFPGDISHRERDQFKALFGLLHNDFQSLKEDWKNFQKRKDIDDFKTIVDYFLRIVERHSTYIKSFVALVKEKAIPEITQIVGEKGSRGPKEFPDTIYSIFREKYNHFIMDLSHFISVTRSLHGRTIDDWRLTSQFLAPRLFSFYLSTAK